MRDIHVEIKDTKEEVPGSKTHINIRVCITPSVHITKQEGRDEMCLKGTSFVHLQTFQSQKNKQEGSKI